MKYAAQGYAACDTTPNTQHRTLDALASAVDGVRASRHQVEAMLNRFMPSPPTDNLKAAASLGAQLGRDPYNVSLSNLQSELDRLRKALDELGTHI